MSQPKSNEELIQPILSKYDVKFMDGSTYGAAELFAKELLEALAQKDAEVLEAVKAEREKILKIVNTIPRNSTVTPACMRQQELAQAHNAGYKQLRERVVKALTPKD